MALKRIDMYDDKGFVETIYEEVPDVEIPVEDIITQKEEQLLSMYQELEELKKLRGNNVV